MLVYTEAEDVNKVNVFTGQDNYTEETRDSLSEVPLASQQGPTPQSFSLVHAIYLSTVVVLLMDLCVRV